MVETKGGKKLTFSSNATGEWLNRGIIKKDYGFAKTDMRESMLKKFKFCKIASM